MVIVDVRIAMVDGKFVASQDVVRLSKSKGETIKWHNDTIESVRLDFPGGSPFPADRNPYDIAPGKHVASGNIHVAEGTEWFYTIAAASGAMADPQIIIER